MSIDEQPMNVYWSGKRTETNNNFKTSYKGSIATKDNLPSLGNKTGDMYNVTESGENFIWNGSSWDSLSGDTLKTLNWQKSEKAGAVAIYPVSETMLEPVVDFLFTETPPASGDKGTENPSVITGVSSVKMTKCGKNLFGRASAGTETSNGLTLVRNADGTCTLSGTATANTFFYINTSNLIQTKAGLTYTLSGCPSGGSSSTYRLACATIKAGTHYYYVDYGSGTSSSKPFDAKWQMYIYVVSGAVISTPIIFKPQFELGPNATSFEPYESTAYTIDLGSTYYGGSVDLGAGLITVTHAAMTPEASVVDISSAPAALPLDYTDTFGRTITSADGTSLSVGSAGGTVVYKLAVPYTVQITPQQILSLSQKDKYTPRLNTIYSDASSVQVGYVKSPIRSEYELTQAIAAIEGSE